MCSRNIRLAHNMYYDLSVLYNKEGGAHRERLASLAAAGYDVVALDCRPDTPGRISSADRYMHACS